MARRGSSKKFIQSAIKRPGALTKAKKGGESTAAAAARLKKSGTTLQKQQANFYLNVLAPANRKRKGSGGSKKKTGATHRVRGHTRTTSTGKKVRVRAHRRKK